MSAMETMINVDGGTVWAQDTGGTGNTVVLLHPGIGDSRVWDPVMPRLSARYRVIRYDARGWGQSPAATVPFTLLGDLIAVLDALDVPEATFVGCSQGGTASIDLALAQPRRVRALVLVSPGVSGFAWPEDPETNQAAATAFGTGDVDSIARWALRVWCDGADDEASVAQLRSAAKAWIGNGRFEQESPDAISRLGQITAPTVLLVGDRDYPPLIQCDEVIVEGIPGCRKIDVPGGDHLLPLRVPDLIADTIDGVSRS
jgi:3-oxoadipate enol-lactonase